ncbi:MAG: inner-rane translocator [Oscillospiraceae bacterium]|nr:inner-rane translocator [Oscillospiraceae bacterium]
MIEKNSISVAKDPRSPLKKFMGISGSGVFIALIIWIVLVCILSPIVNPAGNGFNVATNIISVLKQQTYIGIVACALTLVIITGNIDLSVGSMLTLTACVCASLVQYGFAAAVFGTILVGALLGLVNGILVSGLQLNSFITTLGTGSIYGSFAIIYCSGGSIVPPSLAAFEFLGKGSVGIIPMPVIILAVVVAIFAFVLMKTVFGQRLYVIGANPVAARYSGISARRDMALTYVFTGAAVGLAAVIMVANVMSAKPQAASGKEMEIIMAVVLGGTSIMGGKGTILGTVLGFAFIGFLANGSTALGLNQYLQWVIMGIILVAALSADIMKEKGVVLPWKKSK